MKNRETAILLGIMVVASFLLILLFSPWSDVESKFNSKSSNVAQVRHGAGFSHEQSAYVYNMIVAKGESFLYDLTNVSVGKKPITYIYSNGGLASSFELFVKNTKDKN